MNIVKRILSSAIARSQKKPWLHDKCIALYGSFFSLPYQADDMEFTLGVWAGISTIRCVEGRQIGETNSVPSEFQRQVPTHFHSGNLDGSRTGYSINLTALHHIMRLWPELLEVTSLVRQTTLAHLQITHKTLTAIEVYLVAMVGVSMPAFLARRQSNPLTDKNISSLIADQQKLITGVFMMIRHMLERGDLRLHLDTYLTGTELYDYADHEGLFLSPTGAKTACGGSKRKIIEFIDHIIYGPEKGNINGATKKLDEISGIDNTSDFMNYAISGIELELATMLARAAIRKQLLTAIATNQNSNDSRWLRIKEKLNGQPELTKNLTHQVTILSGMLKVIGRLDNCRQWLALCHATENSDLTAYQATLTELKSYYTNTQNRILCTLGRSDLKKNSITLLHVNQKLDVVPTCVFNEVIKL